MIKIIALDETGQFIRKSGISYIGGYVVNTDSVEREEDALRNLLINICKEFNDTDILKHWHVANTGLVNYKDVFKYYEITHALVYNKEVINSYIKSDKDYKLIYKDDYFSLYKKK